jgi:hypothetical protein
VAAIKAVFLRFSNFGDGLHISNIVAVFCFTSSDLFDDRITKSFDHRYSKFAADSAFAHMLDRIRASFTTVGGASNEGLAMLASASLVTEGFVVHPIAAGCISAIEDKKLLVKHTG